MHLDFRGAFSFFPSKTTADRSFLDNRKNRGMMKPRKEEFHEISSDSEPGRRRIFSPGSDLRRSRPHRRRHRFRRFARHVARFLLTGGQVCLAIISTYLLAFLQAGASVFNQIGAWTLPKSLFCRFATLYAAYVGGLSDQYVDSLPSSGRAYFYRHFRCNLYYNLAHRLSDRPDNGKENDCSVALIFSTETEHKNDSLRIYCSVRSDFLCLSMKTNTRSEKSTVLPNKKTSSYECISENVPTKSVRN